MRAKLFRSMFKNTPAIELQKLGEEYAQELVSALSPEILLSYNTINCVVIRSY